MAYRKFITEYYLGQSAQSSRPIRVGYASTLENAKKNIAVHLILGDIEGVGLGVVRHRRTRARLESLRVSDLKFKHYEATASEAPSLTNIVPIRKV
jgi:hypothetical protein